MGNAQCEDSPVTRCAPVASRIVRLLSVYPAFVLFSSYPSMLTLLVVSAFLAIFVFVAGQMCR
jgi:hypothetical protein